MPINKINKQIHLQNKENKKTNNKKTREARG